MDGNMSFFSSLYELTASFGGAYWHTIEIFFNSVFRRPLRFIFRNIRGFIRFLFRSLVMFFSPASSDASYWADDVTRAAKRCVKVFFKHPASFFSVFFYYVKKALGRYEFSIKNTVLWVMPLIFFILAVTGYSVVSSKDLALLIIADGEEIGCVETEADYLEVKKSLKKALGQGYSDEKFPDITYSLSLVSPDRFTDSDALYDKLIAIANDDMVNACGVYIEEELTAVLYSEAQARSVLEGLLRERQADKNNYTVSFAQNIEYRQGLFPENSVNTAQELEKILLNGNEKRESYTAKSEDTVKSVCEKYKMSETDFRSLNSLAEDEELEEGKTYSVEGKESILSFKEIRTEITAEPVKYDRIEIESPALYSGSTRVLLEGKDGFAQVTSFVTYIDGKKVSSSEVSRLTVTDAVPERVQVGTKPLDEAYSNSMGGIFLWPIVGAYGINSDYGYRWGKLHAGLDLGMGGAAGTSLGKSIIAVAQGTVIVAGVHSSYGYYVIIDHGNGLQTLYAHCLEQSLMVVPGQTVVAGQPIARVGSTGYSTGPHLHFEVRVNGNRVNPRPYLGI